MPERATGGVALGPSDLAGVGMRSGRTTAPASAVAARPTASAVVGGRA